ncbi:MAG: DPP IV N-terminal domain-containing protein [Gemmatimonadales bacterium]
MRHIRTLTFAVLAGALLSLPAAAQEKTRFASLDEALKSGNSLNGSNGPANVNWIDGGARYSYITRGDDGEEIRATDPATGADTLLFSAKGLTFPGTTEPFVYSSFEWSQDSKYLVFQANFKQIYRRSGISDYFVYSLADHTLRPAAKGARTAELSPDGKTLGLERGGDMYVYDLASGKETRLTSDAHGTVYNGHFDWVYEEEFGLAQAWNWSPDDRYLAYWQLDEGAEPMVQFSDYAGVHPVWDTIRIPQPGDSNPTVKIGVSDIQTGKQVWLDTGLGPDTYIPRIYWTSEKDTLAVVTLDRHQHEMHLFFFNVVTGGKRLVMTDRSSTWIDVFDFYAGVQDMLSFPEGTREFFWLSDRDGYQHIYRYDYSGKVLNQVTHGKWEATRIQGTDTKTHTIYYTGTEASPLERQLYSVRFDGSHSRRLTTTAGTHIIDLSPSTQYYIDRWSSVNTPRQVELWATSGKKLKTLEDNAKVSTWVASHAYSPNTLFSFTTSDGVTLDGSLVLPVPFDSTKRYPLVFAVYGGPGSQEVYDSWGGSGYSVWLAQQGYIVVGLNNRGTNNYGSAFMKVVYKHLGDWESHDFAEAAKYLQTKSWVDGKHIAIMGTSYGGYSTVYTMARYPDLFTVGVANSAVTDWRLYDDIYTERYMSLPSDNMAGYDSSSAVVLAPRITGHLLLIHSMMDDNVHPQNTMQFLTAMANAGHDVDLRIYPPGHHGAAYNLQSFLLIEHAGFGWLERWMK